MALLLSSCPTKTFSLSRNAGRKVWSLHVVHQVQSRRGGILEIPVMEVKRKQQKGDTKEMKQPFNCLCRQSHPYKQDQLNQSSLKHSLTPPCLVLTLTPLQCLCQRHPHKQDQLNQSSLKHSLTLCCLVLTLTPLTL